MPNQVRHNSNGYKRLEKVGGLMCKYAANFFKPHIAAATFSMFPIFPSLCSVMPDLIRRLLHFIHLINCQALFKSTAG